MRELLDQPTATCRYCGADIPLRAWERSTIDATCATCADEAREDYLREIAGDDDTTCHVCGTALTPTEIDGGANACNDCIRAIGYREAQALGRHIDRLRQHREA